MCSVVASSLLEIHRVAIVDDDTEQAEVMSLWLEEANFQPIIIRTDRPFEQPQDVVELIRTQAEAAVCDHRLTHHRFSVFNGAELSASLYDSRIPNILTTQYVDMDVDVSIRKWRHKIPVVLSRDETDAESIALGLLKSSNEILGQLSTGRRPHKALLRVTDVGRDGEAPVLDVIIPSWNPLRAVRFPLSLIPVELQQSVSAGTRLFAYVNIGAEESQDLYFDSFELAPEPDLNDGLT
jgi:CheY-like chemotaxis protein